MNLESEEIQIVGHHKQSKKASKNTFQTENSKNSNTQIDNQDQFKLERKKYLQSKLNQRKQVKNVRREQFGSSSSSSDEEKEKKQPNLIKQIQMLSKSSPVQKSPRQEDDSRQKHEAYIKQKQIRKKLLLQQKRKQFGSSSSSYEQKVHKTELIKSEQREQKIPPSIQKVQCQTSTVNTAQTSTVNASKVLQKQIIYGKYPFQKFPNYFQTRKLTILIQSKKNQQWVEQTLLIQNKRIQFLNQNAEFLIAYITKLKLIFVEVNKGYYKIKFTNNNQDYYFAASIDEKIDEIPAYYYILARIVQEKLALIGIQPKKNTVSMFPNFSNLKEIPSNFKDSSYVFGNILKKSQLLGNWQKRFITLDQKGISSSKKANQKASMYIQSQSINQLWTRFDIQANNMLNIKIMYNSTKTEFGIPLSCFTDQYNWLYCFYKVIINNRK